MPSQLSDRILKQARAQQEEVDAGEARAGAGTMGGTRDALTAAMQSLGAAVDSDDEDELGSDGGSDWEEEEEWEEEMTADDEAALAAFMAPGAADYKQRTLSDLIMEKIREKQQEGGMVPGEEQEAGPR